MLHRSLSIHTALRIIFPFMLALCLAQGAVAQDRALDQNAPRKQQSMDQGQSGRVGNTPDPSVMSKSDITHRIIDAPNGTYGYEILTDGKLFVRQTSIPGRPGVEGCRTRQQAENLAELVADKIRSGSVPPTVSAEELKSLGL